MIDATIAAAVEAYETHLELIELGLVAVDVLGQQPPFTALALRWRHPGVRGDYIQVYRMTDAVLADLAHHAGAHAELAGRGQHMTDKPD